MLDASVSTFLLKYTAIFLHLAGQRAICWHYSHRYSRSFKNEGSMV